MKKELQQKLFSSFPKTFRNHKESLHSIGTFGFECRSGWFDLIWRLCEKLEKIISNLPEEIQEQTETYQCKEKFGQLRFYMSRTNTDINNAIMEAEADSGKICEICSQPGQLRNNNNWLTTLCDQHQQEKINRSGAFGPVD